MNLTLVQLIVVTVVVGVLVWLMDAYISMAARKAASDRTETLAEVMDTTTDVPLLIEIEDWVILTDRDLSMLGEARHKTIGGRGVVGRLIAKTDLPRAGTVKRNV